MARVSHTDRGVSGNRVTGERVIVPDSVERRRSARRNNSECGASIGPFAGRAGWRTPLYEGGTREAQRQSVFIEPTTANREPPEFVRKLAMESAFALVP